MGLVVDICGYSGGWWRKVERTRHHGGAAGLVQRVVGWQAGPDLPHRYEDARLMCNNALSSCLGCLPPVLFLPAVALDPVPVWNHSA